MSEGMRLFQKNGWFHVEMERNHSRALKTKDPDEATRMFAKMLKERLQGRLIRLEEVKKTSLNKFKEAFIKARNEDRTLSRWTIKKDELSLKLLADVVGPGFSMVAIDKKKMNEFAATLLARGVKPITINGYYRHLKKAFKWGISEGYLKKMPPISMFKKLKKTEEELLDRIIWPDQITVLLEKASELDPTFGIYCMVSLWTGGRRREALGLEWQRIDFKRGWITMIGKTGQRTIPLLDPVIKALEPIKKDIGRVFPYWHPDTMSHWFKECAVAAEIPKHRLHDLRHTCATYLLKSKVPIETVQAIMGHAQLSTTQIYAKVLPDVMKEEMSKLRFE